MVHNLGITIFINCVYYYHADKHSNHNFLLCWKADLYIALVCILVNEKKSDDQMVSNFICCSQIASHDLMKNNLEAYKYTRSAAPSRSKWRLIDIIAINCIICTHNFYTNGKPRISAFQLYAACKDPSSYY